MTDPVVDPVINPVDPKRDIRISKSLSKLLRHQALKENLTIDSRGFVPCIELLTHNYLKSNKTTLEDIQRVVENDNKQRYTLELKDGEFYICANQGHSISTINTDLIPLTHIRDFPTQTVIHGTSKRNYELIKLSGYLSKMNRNHIHFATGLPDDTATVISGMRSSSTVLLYLKISDLLRDGYRFWKSKNGVILSEGIDGVIPLKYFDIVDRK